MRYRRFVIKNYRAIVGPMEVRFDRGSLTPIIGVNESGKTTILHAIFAFDLFNDDLNEGGRHLKDVSNLYRSSSPPAVVEAEVETTPSELRRIFAECAKECSPSDKSTYEELGRRKKLPSRILIRRTIPTRKYSIASEYFGNNEIQQFLAEKMIKFLPYILYFDDFRDKIAERIEIPTVEEDSPGDWLDILQQLFKQTDKTFSLYTLSQLEVRQRKTVLSKVQRYLNDTLTREWQSFRLDDRDALKIHLEFAQEPSSPSKANPNQAAPGPPGSPGGQPAPPVKNYLKLDVVETDESGDEHFFFISDRSKGFYWFFNFVMKLEFNPKLALEEAHSIYLLDEPGSYLHAFAQRKLCIKLRQISEKNHVLYCTHSHYLLNPENIPISSVMIADKDGSGNVTLTRMIDYRGGSATDVRSAFQPVMDALQIKPYALDLINAGTTVIAEGIYDYFCLELFRGKRSINLLPSVGAESIKFYISLMIAWQIDFRALWDNDAEGRKQHSEAVKLFGPQIAERSLRLLPHEKTNGHWIMQNLFNGSDITRVRQELGLAQDCSFERTILALFYSPDRVRLLEGMSQGTLANFDSLFESLSIG